MNRNVVERDSDVWFLITYFERIFKCAFKRKLNSRRLNFDLAHSDILEETVDLSSNYVDISFL